MLEGPQCVAEHWTVMYEFSLLESSPRFGTFYVRVASSARGPAVALAGGSVCFRAVHFKRLREESDRLKRV